MATGGLIKNRCYGLKIGSVPQISLETLTISLLLGKRQQHSLKRVLVQKPLKQAARDLGRLMRN